MSKGVEKVWSWRCAKLVFGSYVLLVAWALWLGLQGVVVWPVALLLAVFSIAPQLWMLGLSRRAGYWRWFWPVMQLIIGILAGCFTAIMMRYAAVGDRAAMMIALAVVQFVVIGLLAGIQATAYLVFHRPQRKAE